MAIISNSFIEDTRGNSLNIEPLIVLAEKNNNDVYDVLDIYSTKQISVLDENNNNYLSKGILKKISSIKNAVDFENKRLKINTFRFTIYNYYDIKEKLSNVSFASVNNSLIGKYVILYYKTQSSNKINLNQNIETLDDSDSSIIFYGIVNRVTQQNDSITIQAEDETQPYISDKTIPKTKPSDLSPEIYNNILEADKGMEVVPIIYGKVDRTKGIRFRQNGNFTSYIAPYNSSDGTLGIIHDNHPLFGSYNLRKISSSRTLTSFLAFKDDDWFTCMCSPNISSYNGASNFGQNDFYLVPTQGISYIDLSLGNSGSVLPNLSQSFLYNGGLAQGFSIVFPQSAYMDLTGNSSLLEVQNYSIDSVEVHPEQNIFSNNGGHYKRWYREDETFFDTPIDNTIFDTGVITYTPQTHDNKKGRWIILKLEREVEGMRLPIMSIKGYASEDGVTTNTKTFYLYSKLINYDNMLESIEDDENIGQTLYNYWYKYNQTGGSGISFGNYIGLPADNNSVYSNESYNMFSGSYDWTQAPRTNTYKSDAIAIWEWYSDEEEMIGNSDFGSHENISVGWKFHNFAVEEVKDFDMFEDDIYASIMGRKDYLCTENLEETQGLSNALTSYSSNTGIFFGAVLDNGEIDTICNYIDNYFLTRTEEFMSDWTFDNNDNIIFDSPDFLQHNIDNENWILTSSAVLSSIFLVTYRKFLINYVHKIIYDLTQDDTLLETHPDYPEHGIWTEAALVWVENNPDIFEEIKTTYEEESYAQRKALYRRLLKYVFMNDLEDDDVDNEFTGYLYNWDSFDINTDDLWAMNEWINNIAAYLDDTLNTINKSVFDLLSGFIVNDEYSTWQTYQERVSLYSWTFGGYLTYNFGSVSQLYGGNPGWSTDLVTDIQDEVIAQATNNTNLVTNGFIQKPTDIILNILSKEMSFGITENNDFDLSVYDYKSINKSREVYADWKMGFIIDTEQDGKKVIENLLNETKSFFTFTPEGKFSLVTIKNKYVWDDIDHFVENSDVIKYKITRTKRENLIISSKYHYRYDAGFKKYQISTDVMKIKDLIPSYTGAEYYNINDITGHKEKKLKYHTETDTTNLLQEYELLNNCNQHLIIDIDLDLSYSKIKVGDIIKLPLINNEKAFGIDYSKVQDLNGQPIYPVFIVMQTELSVNMFKLRCYQLHYLGTDGQHGFSSPEEALVYRANLREYNTKYPTQRNYNYLPPEQREEGAIYVQGGLEIPYGDTNMDGIINVVDIVDVVNNILGDYQYSELGDINEDEILNVVDIVALVEVILA
tara:strand:+ start:2551 stop:6387 length:3837 start_codon:yes stop_codon:yes gene_type:complete